MAAWWMVGGAGGQDGSPVRGEKDQNQSHKTRDGTPERQTSDAANQRATSSDLSSLPLLPHWHGHCACYDSLLSCLISTNAVLTAVTCALSHLIEFQRCPNSLTELIFSPVGIGTIF